MYQTTRRLTVSSRGRADRYEELLGERIRLGRVYIDTVCHQRSADAQRLFNQLRRLDSQLDRFRRYSHDEFHVVAAAEDERWHFPGQPPVVGGDCGLCAKRDLVLLPEMVLPNYAGPGTDECGGAA